MTPTYQPWLHRIAIGVAGCCLFMITAGGMVTSMDAGDSVPDWPLSYGQIIPPMVGNVFYEHGHRMVGWLLGVLTIIQTVWIGRRDPRRWVRRLAYIALPAVIVQGLLGAFRVKIISSAALQDFLFTNPTGADVAALRTVVAVIHTATAQSILCLMAVIALVTSRFWIRWAESPAATTDSIHCDHCSYDLRAEPGPARKCPECGTVKSTGGPGRSPALRRLRRLSVVLVAVVFGQLILGAIRRHTDGTIILHAVGAGVVSVTLVTMLRFVLRMFSAERGLVHFAVLMVTLLGGQLLLGLGSWLLTEQSIAAGGQRPALLDSDVLAGGIITAHVAIGATLLALGVLVTVQAHRVLRISPASARQQGVPAAVQALPA